MDLSCASFPITQDFEISQIYTSGPRLGAARIRASGESATEVIGPMGSDSKVQIRDE